MAPRFPMKRPAICLVSATALAFACRGGASTESPHRSAETLYVALCANCHGEGMEGGQGPSLLQRGQGRMSGSDAELAQYIREGSESGSMPGFAEALNEAETQSLVVYLREKTSGAIVPKGSRNLPASLQSSLLHDYRIECLVDGLDVPWSLAFLPNHSLLYTERTGRIFMLETPMASPVEVSGVPKVWVRDEAGLMSVAVHPDYESNGWVYLTLSDPGPLDTTMTKVVRGRIRNNVWRDEETVFSAPVEEYTHASQSFGSRLAFHGEYLYFTVGDRWEPESAQDLGNSKGKVYRTFPDGRIPPDNPFANRPAALGSIWSYGHRNPQGIAVDPSSGNLWTTEHGPRGGDELNLIRPGRNYGWPLATHGMNYDGTPVSAFTEMEGLESPVRHWTPSIAASPIHFYRGDAFPGWKGSLFLGSLARQQLFRFEVEGARIVFQELVFEGLGRIRDIATGPEGFLYLSLEVPGGPGYLIRLVPAGPEVGAL